MIYLGLDWGESHHDVVVMAETGEVLVELRVDDTIDGVGQIHGAVVPYISKPSEVSVGTESVQGLAVQALIAAGYTVYEVNPLASSRYRDRHHLSGAKSDRGDAKMLADVVRTDRHNHRPYAGNSDVSEAVSNARRTSMNCGAHCVSTTRRCWLRSLTSHRRRRGIAMTPLQSSSERRRQRKG